MNTQTVSIHPKTSIRSVALSVRNLERQIEFYTRVLGLRLRSNSNGIAELGTMANTLLTLIERPDYKRYRGVTGLYHFAILLPNRRELARVISRLFQIGVTNHPTDHIFTKTTYLNDPEGNGIELYCESPEDGSFVIENNDFVTRRADGSLSDGREPLDVKALFSHLLPQDQIDSPMPEDTRVGHIHLYTPDVSRAVEFYHGVLGFDIMGLSSTFHAAFVSAGGYHHHIGLNAWLGEGAPTPPDDALGLASYTIQVPHTAALDQVADRISAAGIAYNISDGVLYITDPFNNDLQIASSLA